MIHWNIFINPTKNNACAKQIMQSEASRTDQVPWFRMILIQNDLYIISPANI